MKLRPARLVGLAVVLSAVACGGSPKPKAESPAPSQAANDAQAEATPLAPKGTVTRVAVRDTIKSGLGVFLQNVTVDAAIKDGKFQGWTIKTIRTTADVDLRPGDVVMRVNGMPIERPEQADAAMRSLENAKTIRVDLEREGTARVIEIPIVD